VGRDRRENCSLLHSGQPLNERRYRASTTEGEINGRSAKDSGTATNVVKGDCHSFAPRSARTASRSSAGRFRCERRSVISAPIVSVPRCGQRLTSRFRAEIVEVSYGTAGIRRLGHVKRIETAALRRQNRVRPTDRVFACWNAHPGPRQVGHRASASTATVAIVARIDDGLKGR